jgi:hypothetical protein
VVPDGATWLTMPPNSPTANANRETLAASKVTSDASRTIVICLAVKRIVGVLLLGICLLVLAGVALNVLKYTFDYRLPPRLDRLFDLDKETNISTWFSSMLLFSNAILLGLIATAMTTSRDRWRRHWVALAIVFVMLSLDEVAAIHEMTTRLLRNALDLSGLFYFAWVVPALILLLVFAMLFLRFLLALPRRTCWLFVLAGTVYISGAVGAEMIGRAYLSGGGSRNLVYSLIASSEEVLEMIGQVAFFCALADYVRSNFDRLIFNFNN